MVDLALFATLIRDLEGLAHQLDLGGPLELVSPIHGNNELNPVSVPKCEVADLILFTELDFLLGAISTSVLNTAVQSLILTVFT